MMNNRTEMDCVIFLAEWAVVTMAPSLFLAVCLSSAATEMNGTSSQKPSACAPFVLCHISPASVNFSFFPSVNCLNLSPYYVSLPVNVFSCCSSCFSSWCVLPVSLSLSYSAHLVSALCHNLLLRGHSASHQTLSEAMSPIPSLPCSHVSDLCVWPLQPSAAPSYWFQHPTEPFWTLGVTGDKV